MRRWMTVLSAFALLMVAACNTVEGMGEDLQEGGEAVSDTAEKVKDKM